jgi:FkbM family methyltransferase
MRAWGAGFVGSVQALKCAQRDLPNLDRVIALTPGRAVAVQAGGNNGLYPKRLSEYFAVVYTFEPAADCFAAMQVNAPEANIYRFQAALGCERQLVGLSRVRRDGKTNNHEGITHVAGTGPVPTLQVDDLGLSVCDLLQLDLEGWELYALTGAAGTLARCRPVVCVEINKSCGYVGIAKDDVRAYLRGHDYRFVERLSSDEVFLPAEWGRP